MSHNETQLFDSIKAKIIILSSALTVTDCDIRENQHGK